MIGRNEPEVVMSTAVADFAAQLPGLRDGDAAAIHDARVAIRRLREAAALARSAYDEQTLADMEERLSAMFRALGRARDADTEHDLVRQVEARFPSAPTTLGQLAASVNDSRLKARRKIVKTLETLELENMASHLARGRRTSPRLRIHRQRWSAILRTHIAHRAVDVRNAIDHAGGVYFRKRAHSARVAIKQLRYTLEFARRTGVWRDRRAIRTLRRAQDWLGQAHDREVLLNRLRGLTDESAGRNAMEVRFIEQFLEGEIRALHERYLAARPEILDVCRACLPDRQAAIPLAPIAAALALPAFFFLRREQRVLAPGKPQGAYRRHQEPRDVAVSVK